MSYDAAATLDLVNQSQSGHAATVNNAFKALSPAALFGIKQSLSSGLVVVFYGGNMNVAGVPTAIADQTITLTASTTNYIYATSAGVVTKTTSAPAGWPGPLAAGAIALYSITTNAAAITGGTNYRVGVGIAGPQGATGAQGNPGSDFALTRKRIMSWVGGNNTTLTAIGFNNPTVVGTVTARALGSGNLSDSIGYAAYLSSGTAGSSAQVHAPQDWCYLGNAAGRGGFTLAIRFRMETAAAPANQRSFFGLFSRTTFTNAEPDTFVNLMGIGAKAGDANFSVLHNDGTGTATMSTLGSNFPARNTDNTYELLLQSVANSGVVSYTLTEIGAGNVASGSYSSDIPSNTTFLSWVAWTNNGSTAAQASFGLMQVVAETRY